MSSFGFESLSPRELDVIRAWIRVGMNKLVAAELGLAEQTVKNHVTSILRKLDAVSIGHAALRYDRWAATHHPGRERRIGVERRRGERRRAS